MYAYNDITRYLGPVSKRFPEAIVFPRQSDYPFFGNRGRIVSVPLFKLKDGLIRGEEVAWPIRTPALTPEEQMSANLDALESYSNRLYESASTHGFTPETLVIMLDVDEFPDNQTIWKVGMWLKCHPKEAQVATS